MILQINNDSIKTDLQDLNNSVNDVSGKAYFVQSENCVYSLYESPKVSNPKWIKDATRVLYEISESLENGYTDVTSSYNSNEILAVPRIKKFQIDKNKNFKSVDHNTELKVSLSTDEVYGSSQSDKALLVRKNYSYNGDLIFFIEYDYNFDVIGQISEQSLVLKWINESGDINSDIKEKGFKTLSNKESRKAVLKRRESAIMLLETDVMNLLSSGANNDAEYTAAIDHAASMLSDVSVEINKFKSSGISTDLTTKLNNIKGTYIFLESEVAPNITVIDYITNFLNY